MNILKGGVKPLCINPNIPAVELKKINSAEIAAVSRMLLQDKYNNSGERKIPPPIPINPETEPRIAPINRDKMIDDLFSDGGSVIFPLRRWNTGTSSENAKIFL